jgi:hypothetical protein
MHIPLLTYIYLISSCTLSCIDTVVFTLAAAFDP